MIMSKAILLAFALILVPLVRTANARPQSLTDIERAEKVKADVTRRIANKKEKVTVKLQSGAEVKGRLTQAGANSFFITDQKSGTQTEIAYSDVAKVKGKGLSKWTKIAIVTGVAVTVVAVIGVISFKNFDPFEHGILFPR